MYDIVAISQHPDPYHGISHRPGPSYCVALSMLCPCTALSHPSHRRRGMAIYNSKFSQNKQWMHESTELTKNRSKISEWRWSIGYYNICAAINTYTFINLFILIGTSQTSTTEGRPTTAWMPAMDANSTWIFCGNSQKIWQKTHEEYKCPFFSPVDFRQSDSYRTIGFSYVIPIFQ